MRGKCGGNAAKKGVRLFRSLLILVAPYSFLQLLLFLTHLSHAMVLKVSFRNALTGDVVAAVDVASDTASAFGIMERAGLNPYLYHIMDGEDNLMMEENLKSHIVVADKDSNPPVATIQIVARPRETEVHWYLASETNFQGQVARCERVLPSVFLDNDNPKLEAALNKLIPNILPQYSKLIRLIQQDIENISSIRRRKLDVARHYDHSRCCWIICCIFVLADTNLKLRLKMDEFRVVTDDVQQERMVDEILRDVNTIDI